VTRTVIRLQTLISKVAVVLCVPAGQETGRVLIGPPVFFRFPNGFAAVASYIHSLNMSSGLYTAKGPNTCAGYAASCDHEFQDAAQWASWGIECVKLPLNVS
jgi:hypothetical protein